MAGRSGDWEPEDHTGIRDEEAWGGTGADPGGEKGRYRLFQHGFGGASGFRVAGKISASAGIFLLYLQKKEFCAHRAAAALWCRMEAGTLRLEEFEKEEEEPKADLNRIREKAGEMKAALEDILASGLSRTASQSADALERLAVISHNEGLASFEDAFRSLQNGYEAYFSRSSSVNAAGLMDESARLYEQICRLSRVKTDGSLGTWEESFTWTMNRQEIWN